MYVCSSYNLYSLYFSESDIRFGDNPHKKQFPTFPVLLLRDFPDNGSIPGPPRLHTVSDSDFSQQEDFLPSDTVPLSPSDFHSIPETVRPAILESVPKPLLSHTSI